MSIKEEAMAAFTAGYPAALPSSIVLPAQELFWNRLNEPVSRKITDPYYLNLIYGIVSKVEAFSGWYSAEARSSMKRILEYMGTDAGIVKQFQRVQEQGCFSNGKEGDVPPALFAFFQRMSGPDTLRLFSQMDALPPGIERITIRFLVWLHQANRTPEVTQLTEQLLRRFMKIPLLPDSVARNSSYVFTWIDRDRVIATSNMPTKALCLASWTGAGVFSGIFSEATLLFYITEAKLEGTKFFAWEVETARKQMVACGFEESIELAAEECYKAFYIWNTQAQFLNALKLGVGKEIVVLGNELTAEEYLKYKGKVGTVLPEAQSADREGTMFVIDWPASKRQKRTFKIRGYKPQYRNEPAVAELFGGAKLDDDLLYYVKCPERYVKGEVICPKCFSLGTVDCLGMKYVQSKGPLCGPCIDHMMERDELHEAQFDSYSDNG